MNTPKKGGRPPLGRARKQEYRITLRCNTACNFKLRALARAAGIPRTEVLRQLILNGSVRERLRSEHLEWLSQLKGLARNLNQLAGPRPGIRRRRRAPYNASGRAGADDRSPAP